MPKPKIIIGWLVACAVGILIGAGATYVLTTYRGMQIQSFATDKQEIMSGETVTFRWNISGATEVAFHFVHLPTGSNGDLWESVMPEVSAGNLPPSGEWVYTMPPEASDLRFKMEIEGMDEAGNKVAARSEQIRVKYWSCFEGNADCTAAPITTKAMIQTFENGTMLWREDTKTIYVMGDPNSDGTNFILGWRSFPDTWAADQRFETGDHPPVGLLPPHARFVKIIAINPDVLGGIGWATAPEIPFEAAIQQTRTGCNMGCSPSLLVKLNDRRILHLAAGDLEHGYIWNITPAS